MTIQLTAADKLIVLQNCMCDGLHYFSGYGVFIEFDENMYNETKAKYNVTCWDMTLAHMINDDIPVTFIDEECNGDYTKEITNSTLNWAILCEKHANTLVDILNGNYDAETCDIALQVLIWGDIIFC